MTTAQQTYPTLIDRLWPAQAAPALRWLALMFLGTIALTISAKIEIPFWPVPLTMQTFAALVIGAAYGWRLAGATLLLYLAEGALGLPVFAGTPERGIGLAYMAGPTGGYLVGFLLGAVLVGWLAERGWDRTPVLTFAAVALGHALVFVPGVLWLAQSMGFAQAVAVGVAPFWLATLLKTALAMAVLPFAWKLVGRARG